MDFENLIQLFKDIHPRPTQVNITQAAETLGKSAPTVRKYIMEGKIKLNDARQIPIAEIDKFAFPAESEK